MGITTFRSLSNMPGPSMQSLDPNYSLVAVKPGCTITPIASDIGLTPATCLYVLDKSRLFASGSRTRLARTAELVTHRLGSSENIGVAFVARTTGSRKPSSYSRANVCADPGPAARGKDCKKFVEAFGRRDDDLAVVVTKKPIPGWTSMPMVADVAKIYEGKPIELASYNIGPTLIGYWQRSHISTVRSNGTEFATEPSFNPEQGKSICFNGRPAVIDDGLGGKALAGIAARPRADQLHTENINCKSGDVQTSIAPHIPGINKVLKDYGLGHLEHDGFTVRVIRG